MYMYWNILPLVGCKRLRRGRLALYYMNVISEYSLMLLFLPYLFTCRTRGTRRRHTRIMTCNDAI